MNHFHHAFLLPLVMILSAPCLLAQAEPDLADLPGRGDRSAELPTTSTTAIVDLLPLALEPVEMNTSPLPDYGLDRLDYALSEGIEITPGGRLWACWVAGGDNDEAFVVLSTSEDRGNSWSAPRAVLDPHRPGMPIGIRALVANLWTDPAGRLWLFFDQGLGYFDGRAGVWATLCEKPDADAPTWSTPKRLWHGAALNKPIVTSTGEWLLPVSLWPRDLVGGPFKEEFAELDEFRMANVLASTDQGQTWHRRGGARMPHQTVDENMLIERRDGSLWMTSRTKEGIWECLSSDGGRTWTEPSPSSIAHVNSRHFIRRLASGRLLLVKHGLRAEERPTRVEGATVTTLTGRIQLSAFLSDDDGKSWKGGLLLAPDTASYPDGVQGADGTIYVCYDRDRWFKGEFWLSRFTEEDILAGKLVKPDSAMDILISRAIGLTEEERATRMRRIEAKRTLQQQPRNN